MDSNIQGAAASPEMRPLGRLRARVADSIVEQDFDPTSTLLNARFPGGAQLPDAAGGGSLDPHSAIETGWLAVDSWQHVATAALTAGRGGFTLVRLNNPVPKSIGIHTGGDDSDPTLWIIHVDPDAKTEYSLFDPSQTTNLPTPTAIAVISYCGEV